MAVARRSCALALSVATVLSGAGAVSSAGAVVRAAAPRPTAGAPGAGDPYFPRQGNGGYDVRHYDLRLSYRPATHHLAGTARVTAVATQALSRFDLDLRRSLTVSRVLVDGVPAAARQPAAQVQELVITPRVAIAAGRRFTVRVDYAGTAAPVHDPDGSLDGWIPTGDGAFVANEPQGAPTWFPVNDTPDDKATYRVAITVPRGLQAIGNGALVSRVVRGDRTTWTWQLARPVSSYLVTATVGRYVITRGRTPSGIPYLDAVDPTQQAGSVRVLRRLPFIIDYFASKYGRYPFGNAGAIVDNATQAGYALETATRPIFDRAPDIATLSHELAHQWFGDSVTLRHWSDIWLNEGFAEFSSWLWTEHTGGPSAAARLRSLLALPAGNEIWSPPPGNPGTPDQIFSDSVYERGAGTLQALRELVGNRTFFSILRGWAASHRYGNAAVGQFTAYAAQVAHRDLAHFFDVWLYRHGKPNLGK